MTEYKQGDAHAFKALYERHSRRVYGFLMTSLKDSAMAEDVFQATFLKLHRARDQYDPTYPFVPWLFTICRSVMVDSLRRSRRVREELDEVAVARAEAPEPIEATRVVPDLSGLPQAQRAAVELRYGQDLSFDEIARRLETSPSNVRQLVSRAVRKLKVSK